MVINGIGGLNGPSEPVPADRKARDRSQSPASTSDAVSISAEAAQAADASRLTREADKTAENEYQQRRIEEAKRNIEEGTYRLQSVVLEIAGRITGYVNQG